MTSSSVSPPRKRKRKEQRPPEPEDRDSDESNSEAEPTADEPVLSHAERRRRKRAARLGLAREGASADKRRKLLDGTASPTVPEPSTTSKRQNSVWVGNLSFKTTREDIKGFFGDACEITRIHLPLKATTRPGEKSENRGFAYVDFATSEAKLAAVGLCEQPLLGRKLLIKDGNDFTGRPLIPGLEPSADRSATSTTHSKTAQRILRAQKQPAAPTLFLGNLGFEVTEDDIRQLFEAHRSGKNEAKDKGGERKDDVWIRRIRMGTFEDSGRCKGFAFVDFTSVDHATAILINPKNHQLNGRKLVVEYSSPDAVRRGAPKSMWREGNVASARQQNLCADNSRSHAHTSKLENVSEIAETGDRQKIHLETRDKRTKRLRPGATLAQARRQSAAIVPNEGRKITF